jgi:hypothetical protein
MKGERGVLMKSKSILIFSLILLFSFIGIQSAVSSDCITHCDPKTPGYWKNHPEEIPAGGVGPFSKANIIYLLDQAVKGDKRVTFVKAYIAALLNVDVNGCRPPHICMSHAHTWWANNNMGVVRANSEAWQLMGEHIYWCLDDYNNGEWWWCGPHT